MKFCSASRCINCAMRLSLRRTHGRLDALLLSLTPSSLMMHAALCCECKPNTLMRRKNSLTAVAAEAEGHAGARAQGVPPQGGLPQHRQDAAHDSPRGTCATHAADTAVIMCMAAKQSPSVSSLRRSVRRMPLQNQIGMPTACKRTSRCDPMSSLASVR